MQNVLHVGSRKGLIDWTFTPDGWQLSAHHFAGIPVTAIAVSSATRVVALREGHFGPKLRISHDAGQSWQELPPPAFTAGMEGEPSVDQIWSLDIDAQDRWWAGCIPAGLFCSTDQGASWALCSSLWNLEQRAKWFGGGYDAAGIHSILTGPAEGEITVGISCGGVWRSMDNGAHWDNYSKGMWAAYMPPEQREDPDVQDPHRLSRCAAVPQTVWCQHHNAQFVSTDNLAYWREIKPAAPLSNFGFVVVAHPVDPKTAWFVPAEADNRRYADHHEFYVLRTRDGGETFDKLSKGLPPTPAFHLVYRHGMVVDHSGNRLAMASTTGSVWVSDNAGDEWARLSAEMPPVYCLAFST